MDLKNDCIIISYFDKSKLYFCKSTEEWIYYNEDDKDKKTNYIVCKDLKKILDHIYNLYDCGNPMNRELGCSIFTTITLSMGEHARYYIKKNS